MFLKIDLFFKYKSAVSDNNTHKTRKPKYISTN